MKKMTTLLLTWKQVEKRIRELISSGRYFNQQEEDEYYDWLDANGIKNNMKNKLKMKIINLLKDSFIYK